MGWIRIDTKRVRLVVSYSQNDGSSLPMTTLRAYNRSVRLVGPTVLCYYLTTQAVNVVMGIPVPGFYDVRTTTTAR